LKQRLHKNAIPGINRFLSRHDRMINSGLLYYLMQHSKQNVVHRCLCRESRFGAMTLEGDGYRTNSRIEEILEVLVCKWGGKNEMKIFKRVLLAALMLTVHAQSTTRATK
jgi:hypothetical protein